MNEGLHQIRYRWTERSLLGERGMGPVESSLPQAHIEAWDALLRDHVWATGPEPAFTYLWSGEAGALIRKVTTAGGGRPGSSAHVLVGGRFLSPKVAIGLTTWTGWDAPELTEVPWSRLAPAARQGIRDVRRRSRALAPDRLAVLVAHLLSASGEPFSVLAEADPLAVVMAFTDLVGRPAGFATDEADDNGTSMPEAVFLKEAPFSTTIAARRRLMAQVSPADAELHTFADALVRAYRMQGRDGVARVRLATPPGDAAEAHAWARRAQFRPGVLADLTRLHLLGTDILRELAADPGPVTAAAITAPAADLAYALGQAVPEPLSAGLVTAALRRAVPPDGDHTLLEALAKHAPIGPGLLAPYLPVDLDRLAYVTGLLLSREDRLSVLTGAVAALSAQDLISWIGERATDDPDAAWAGFHQMLDRVPGLARPDLDALVRSQLLAVYLRAVLGSPPDVARAAAMLLAAFPEGTHDLGTLTPLIDHGDPAVLHAVETVVADPAVRDAVLRRIRFSFYQAQRLPPPAPPQPAGGDAPGGSRWPLGRRRRSANDRTAT